MKKLLILLPFFALFSFSLFNLKSSQPNRVDRIKIQLVSDADQILKRSEELNKAIASKLPKDKIVNRLIEVRKAYKKIELFLGYFEPSLEKKINGPNIPVIASDGLNLNIYDPSGMQVIEEMISEENPNYEELIQLSSKLIINLKKVKQRFETIALEDRFILEACRDNIIRIETIGLNAFDNPVLNQTFVETTITWNTTYQYIKYYFDISNNQKLNQEIKILFEAGQNELNKASFESFDRFSFIKDIADPLHKKLYELHLATQIETFDEVSDLNRPTNYAESGLFNSNLLNQKYFARGHDYNEKKELILLGKTLFFDPVLSGNNERSCASCHDPQKAFTDGADKSVAFDFDGKVGRNSPTIINAVYQSHFFWDMRSEALDQQFKHVIASKKEFNTNYTDMCNKLNQSEEYREMFKTAYDDERITPHRVSAALEAFVRSIRGMDSKFDKMIRGEIAATDKKVINGFNLFMGKANCSTCHFAPTFAGNVPPYFNEMESEVLGITKTEKFKELDDDMGRFKIYVLENKNDAIKRAFKTPTVRNIKLTAPYMHHGGFKSLEKVVEFYNNGGGAGMGLDVPNQTLPVDSLHLSDNEIQDLVHFMNALTDTSCVQYAPKQLPKFNIAELDNRIIGGKY